MSAAPPAISVVIPAFNAERTVGAAVDSVLEQTFENFELIVIDDGSSDGTADSVRSRGDPRLSCVTTPNGGVARARNHGVALSQGSLVAFLDADDLWYPAKLESQHELMASRASVGLCYTSTELVDDHLVPIRMQPALQHGDYTKALLLSGNIVTGASSPIVRRSLLEATGGFDPLLSQCADWDLWLRLSLETRFAPIPEPLVRYRKAPDTMSSDPALLERDTFAMLEKFFAAPLAAPYARLRSRVYGMQWMVCSGTYLHAGMVRDSLRCMARGVAADPRSVTRPLMLPARRLARRSGGSSGRRHPAPVALSGGPVATMSPMGASSGRLSAAKGDGESGTTNAAHFLAPVTRLTERLRFSAGMLAHQRRGLRYGRAFDGTGANGAALPREPSALETYFDEHVDGPGIWKWRHYFDIYDRHLRTFRGRPVHMVEIGVYAGGSIAMWRQYFGPESHIYGIDIEASCLEHAAENVEIVIGDQSSREFWARFVSQVPRIDVVLDDGGHTFEQQVTSLECLLPHLEPGGVYICEDTVGIANPFHDYVVGLARNLHSDRPMEGNPDGEAQVQQTALQRSIESVHIYPFVTVIEKRASNEQQFELRRHGTQWPSFG